MAEPPCTWRSTDLKCGRAPKNAAASSAIRCSRSSGVPSDRGSVLQLGEPLVGPAAEDLGDKVLLAVEEFVDRRRRIARKVADAAQRAVPQAVFAKDPFCGVEDFRHGFRAARSAALTAHLRPSRIGHGDHHNHFSP